MPRGTDQKAKKMRLDQMLVERNLAPSRSRAQAYILDGNVFTEDKKLEKPGQKFLNNIPLNLRQITHSWVSRGGMKLEKALTEFKIDPSGMIVLDVGASTGGFTDVCLVKGARKVYAVDVGHGQLADKIRQDERVIVFEKTNARYLTAEMIKDAIDLIVCDASFIGLRTVLPAAMGFAKKGARLVALIKPQFEAGKGKVGKGGIVRDAGLHDEVCKMITDWINNDMAGWIVKELIISPVEGSDGNTEFLIYAEYHS